MECSGLLASNSKATTYIKVTAPHSIPHLHLRVILLLLLFSRLNILATPLLSLQGFKVPRFPETQKTQKTTKNPKNYLTNYWCVWLFVLAHKPVICNLWKWRNLLLLREWKIHSSGVPIYNAMNDDFPKNKFIFFITCLCFHIEYVHC